MALYQDGILISGANTLPKMTLAEYNALPADQRPTYWERLDADYDDILAEKSDIGNIETGSTASKAYSTGELLYYNGTLHRVKVPIASGAAFTEGTNVEPANVSEALNKSEVNIIIAQTASRAITLSRYGKVRVLNFVNVSIDGSTTLSNLSDIDVPLTFVRGVLISLNNGTPYMVELDNSKNIKLYRTATLANETLLNGSLVWIVN